MSSLLYHPQPKYAEKPPFAAVTVGQFTRASQRAGIRYQQRVESHLLLWAGVNGWDHNAGPWVEYTDPAGRKSYAQPDLVLLCPPQSRGIIVETKLTHTRNCVKQLQRYKYLLQFLHPGYTFSLIEVCKNFDNSEYPMPLLETFGPHDADVAAYLWKPL